MFHLGRAEQSAAHSLPLLPSVGESLHCPLEFSLLCSLIYILQQSRVNKSNKLWARHEIMVLSNHCLLRGGELQRNAARAV